MENFRWIMLGVGLGIIVLVYLWSKRGNKSEHSEYREPLTADELPSLSSHEDDVLFSNKDDYEFVPSEINKFELNQELVEQVSASVDDGLVDVITTGSKAPSRRLSALETDPAVSTRETANKPQEHGQKLDQPLTRQTQSDDNAATTNELASEHTDNQYDDDLIVIHVEAKDAYFSGADLLHVINHQQLKYGEMNIYHAYDENNKIIFSMSNMLKPGHFEPEHFSDMRTPGLILFMQLSLVESSDKAFERMLGCADAFSKHLGGRLTVASRQRLTEGDINEFKKKADYFLKKEKSNS